ncbi:hypothetical protein Zmor_005064 [Zophobas morio]|uniref:Uncharacterized protein n=1 Tax=Zophobas morio TaxID=2755281 RepID=A0AA38IRG9_9CUCU|nr:hypothetical protein Zmor_005064 [Zophobas morio]
MLRAPPPPPPSLYYVGMVTSDAPRAFDTRGANPPLPRPWPWTAIRRRCSTTRSYCNVTTHTGPQSNKQISINFLITGPAPRLFHLGKVAGKTTLLFALRSATNKLGKLRCLRLCNGGGWFNFIKMVWMHGGIFEEVVFVWWLGSSGKCQETSAVISPIFPGHCSIGVSTYLNSLLTSA